MHVFPNWSVTRQLTHGELIEKLNGLKLGFQDAWTHVYTIYYYVFCALCESAVFNGVNFGVNSYAIFRFLWRTKMSKITQ